MPVHLTIPKSMANWVSPRPWLTVGVGDAPAVEFRGLRSSLSLHRLTVLPGEKELRRFAVGLSTKPGALVARPMLPAMTRAILEENDVGYLDSRGNLHIVLPNGVIHAEATRANRRVAASGLGVNGVRAVQEILACPGPVTVSGLAKGVSLSLGQTHAVLKLLEGDGYIRSTAAGAARLRSVTDRTQLLDWLATQPAARRREQHLDVVLYARRPEEVWNRLGLALDKARIAYALTGGAAASLLGSGPTNVLTSLVRVDPDVPLEVAARALGATITDRGPNIRLLRDTGRIGTARSEVNGSVRIAPRVRVYLDALGERRGQDVATHFREVVLGY
jgi:hypothetical protein